MEIVICHHHRLQGRQQKERQEKSFFLKHGESENLIGSLNDWISKKYELWRTE
jgi:hypothetical protein